MSESEKIESVDDVESESLEGSEEQQEIPVEALLPEGDESALVTNSDSPEVVSGIRDFRSRKLGSFRLDGGTGGHCGPP